VKYLGAIASHHDGGRKPEGCAATRDDFQDGVSRRRSAETTGRRWSDIPLLRIAPVVPMRRTTASIWAGNGVIAGEAQRNHSVSIWSPTMVYRWPRWPSITSRTPTVPWNVDEVKIESRAGAKVS